MVEHRIATFDPDDRFPWDPEPTAEQIETKRAGLEAERQHVLDELDRLEAAADPPKRGRRRR